MRITRIQKVLYVLYLLTISDYTKDEIIKKCNEAGFLGLNEYLVASYIKTLTDNGFSITTKKEKKKNIYHLEEKPFRLKLNDDEIEALENIKKIVISKKDIKSIKDAMRFFYKFVLSMENDDHKNILIDFDYYSKINWYLVGELEKHCKNKDIILIEYAHHTKSPLKLKIHTDRLSINEWSDKIYLWGEVYENKEISFLPVERIFMILETVEENVPFEIPINEIEYKISRKLYDEIELDKEESVKELTKEFAIIKRNKNNKFYIIQRLMSFCPELYSISDDEIKEKVKENLNKLKSCYEK